MKNPSPANDHQDGNTIADPEIFPLTARECQIVGYVNGWHCNLADDGIDPRKVEAPALLDDVRRTFQHVSSVKPERDLPLIIAVIFALLCGFLGALAFFISWWVAPYCR